MLTLILPTMNRPDFLIRALNYYAETNYKHYILIGDSSYTPHLEKNKTTMKTFSNSLRIIYREYPGLDGREVLHKMYELASTPYVAYIGDDDFLAPSGLEQCIAFLENQPNYSAAHGVGISFTIKCSGPFGEINSLGPYEQPSIEFDVASQRITECYNNYGVCLFSVHRLGCGKEMFKDSNLVMDLAFAGELIPCGRAAIYGKVKQLDCFYLVRQVHDARLALPSLFNWLTSPKWQPSYQIFHDTLRDALMEKEQIDRDTASKTVNLAFEQYLRNAFSKKTLTRKYTIIPSIKKIAKRLPGLKQVYHLARNRIPISRNELSLKGLLGESSPYHEEFMPIYRAITNPPTN